MRPLRIKYEAERKALERFLAKHALLYEEDIDAAFGVYDLAGALRACGCAAGSLLKCFAAEDTLRGQNVLGPLVSALMQNRFSRGIYDIFVVTRAKNEPLFAACGLYPVARSSELAMMENRRNGPAAFFQRCLREEDAGKTAGAIVMNANPFTLGHRFLVEYAAARCDVLYVFVVEEDRSFFPSDVRYRLVRDGTADLPNVRVHYGGHYMISGATFPTYFLKKEEPATALQAELDAILFAESIAPVLHITNRFAGSEPDDAVTALYNETMRTVLPARGIAFTEVPRYEIGGQAVSASLVREKLRSGEPLANFAALLPPVTRAYLENEPAREKKTGASAHASESG